VRIEPYSPQNNRVATSARPARSLVYALAALALLTAIRLAVAATTPLSPDEAYYWVWSRALAAGYLDHPPMVALWIRAGTALLEDTSLGVRLLAPLSAAAGSILLAAAGDRLFPDRRPGLWAAILLNSTLMLGAGAVTITPDTPLIFFWTAALYALARIARGAQPAWWLAVGLAAGLALDSKYTAALLGVGIALWLLTPAMRPTLRTPWPWLGGLLAIVLTLPVLHWNAAHHWASLAKQGGRAADFHPTLRYLAELLAGQFGLATPIIAVSMVIGLHRAARPRRDQTDRHWQDPAPALLAAITLPAAAVFLQHAIGDRVQANWVAILYPTAALAAAAFCPRWQRPAASLGLALTALLYLQASLAPFPLPRALDPTLRLAGFDALSAATAAAARQDGAAFIGSEEYGLASLLAWHGNGLPVLGNEPRWTVFDRPAAVTSAPGLLIISARHTAGPNPDLWQTATLLGTLDRGRHGIVAETYRLYRVTLRPGAPAIQLPGPSA
jgi:4-amino-4-deoxy-L-arabinose transferase-like glycosyltransferase